MEASKLCPELQNIVEQLATFRNKYTHLKTHSAAQEEIIRLQRIEADKMNSRVDRIAIALDDYQKFHNVKLRNLESENQRLRKIMDDYTREKDNECVLRALGDEEERVRNLEENLAELRSRLSTEAEKHREEIEALRKSHEEEIVIYKKRLEAAPVDRDYVISNNKKNQREVENINVENTVASRPKEVTFAHPALDEDNTRCKRKKSSCPAFKWPALDFVAKQDYEPTIRLSTPRTKKKKLYQADNEMIIDLAT